MLIRARTIKIKPMNQPQLSFDFAKAQPEIIAERNTGAGLNLRLGEFDGPLDLLLHLIRQERANIFDIPIARIANEYLRYLRLMKEMDIAVAGDFLVMAATLIEIKSKMLLPLDAVLDADENGEIVDPRRELVNRLLEHQKFKSAAQMLWEKTAIEQSIFQRGKIETDDAQPEITVGMFDLLQTFQKILARRKEEIAIEIAREEMSLEQMLERLRTRIVAQKTIGLSEIFAQAVTRRELILTFLAVLELVKAAQIRLRQSEVFGAIVAEAISIVQTSTNSTRS